MVGITGDLRILIVVRTLRMPNVSSVECRVLVRSGLVVMIQRVGCGERPGKSGGPQLTSTSSTSSTSTLTATSQQKRVEH